MGQERVTMRKTREILRLKYENKRGNREIARSLGVSPSTVSLAVSRAVETGVPVSDLLRLDDTALEAQLYRKEAGEGRPERPAPDCAWIDVERRRPGVTLELLHGEYLAAHPDGYQYTQFCEHYRAWQARQTPRMRQVHRAGEKLFLDYSGKKPSIWDPETGQRLEVELFVAVLGASNYLYAEATRTQQLHDWIGANQRALWWLEGVPGLLVPDQLRSAVSGPHRYEPEVHRTYAEMAAHYGTVVLPARPRKPRDKAKVEGSVLIVQRWILARIRNEKFFSLDALNERIRELVADANGRRMRRYGASRRELFERLDKPALKPLPEAWFIVGEWRKATVNIDYHIEVDKRLYSVPHSLIHEVVEAYSTADVVEVFHKGTRMASHRRVLRPGGYSTAVEHMPAAHRAHQEWSPSRLIAWAETVGTMTGSLVTRILESRPHPEQGYRSCLGILRLAKRYGNERLEAACTRALAAGAHSYRPVASILEHGLDRLAPTEDSVAPVHASHENIRGGTYYN